MACLHLVSDSKLLDGVHRMLERQHSGAAQLHGSRALLCRGVTRLRLLGVAREEHQVRLVALQPVCVLLEKQRVTSSSAVVNRVEGRGGEDSELPVHLNWLQLFSWLCYPSSYARHLPRSPVLQD